MIKNQIKELETNILKNRKFGDMFCLIDGVQIDHDSVVNISRTYGECDYLFKGTLEEEAYLYGPILINLNSIDDEQLNNLFNLMKAKDSLIFLQSSLESNKLKNLLLEKLYIYFENGEIGILRFYDPRVLTRLYQIMDDDQKIEFITGIDTI